MLENPTYNLKRKTNNTDHELMPYLIAIATAIVIASASIYMPSLPEMITFFSGDAEAVLSSTSFFYAGFAIFGVISGYLADRFGRRFIMLLGLLVFLTGSAVCLFSQQLWFYQFGSFLEGMGGAAPLAVGFVSIQDRYNAVESAKIISRMGVIVGLAPCLSTFLGGQLAVLGWRSNYIFLLVSGLLVFIFMYNFYQDPYMRSSNKLSIYDFISSNINVLKNQNFLNYALIYPTLAVGSAAFLSIVPIYLSNELLFNPQFSGYLMSLMMLGWPFGALIASPIIARVGIQKTILIGISLSLVGGCIIFSALFFKISYQYFIFGSLLFQTSMAIVHPPTTTLAIRLFSDLKGVASAMRGAFSMLGSAIGSGIGAIMINENILLIPLVVIFSSLLTCLLNFTNSMSLKKMHSV